MTPSNESMTEILIHNNFLNKKRDAVLASRLVIHIKVAVSLLKVGDVILARQSRPIIVIRTRYVFFIKETIFIVVFFVRVNH